MTTTIDKVKKYWNKKNIPQQWYSNKTPFTIQWFNELSLKRYNTYYEYIKYDAEFENHPGEKVLEIGTGIGTDLIEYAKNGSKVYGIDLGPDQIDLTKLNFKLRNLDYEDLKVCSAENIEYEDETFDLVYSFGVLHHTPDTEKAISEIYRILKPDGQAIIMLYARGWKHYLKRCFIHGILLGKIIKHRFSWQALYDDISEVNGGSPKTAIYTRKQVKKLFRQFPEIVIKKRRLGEFIDYAPYKSRVLPSFIKNFLNLINAASIIGENHLIKLYKSNPPKRKNVFSVIFKHY